MDDNRAHKRHTHPHMSSPQDPPFIKMDAHPLNAYHPPTVPATYLFPIISVPQSTCPHPFNNAQLHPPILLSTTVPPLPSDAIHFLRCCQHLAKQRPL
ncbi:hypothetical protein BOTBODRAFT_279691 [Botryobasidium botryosum FD-172 SS1]|uniref:Uncharacterized protein n=1 Tax=Botryobasidium botryosum (strain FD-172 SS1) TaxID=930990 RepID=A0A067LRU2_BOTB1|nr:hypothetical protein BOTBODRAFT_279691 [Botryobasidium botryosum FD-172 SS1]